MFGIFSVTTNFVLNLIIGENSLHRWAQSRSLSFVPPDGKFILAEYRYAPNASSLSSTSAVLANDARANVPIPFAMKAEHEIDDNSGTFCI